jgi:hypothetical protein
MIYPRCNWALGVLVYLLCGVANAEVNPKHGVVQVKQRVVPARVRILVKVTPFEKVIVQSPRGIQTYTFKPGQEIVHTLRARINRPNHFYFGEWHVSSTPLSFRKDTKQYRVRLNFQKIYGAAANLEESIGDIEVAGVLQPVEDGMFNLVASERMLFKDLEGQPKLNIVAGFNPADDRDRMEVAKLPTENPPSEQTR